MKPTTIPNDVPRHPDRVSIEFPTRSRLIAIFVVGILLGALAMAGGFLLGSQSAPQAPGGGADVAFSVRAFFTGYVGVGGSIDGLTNPTLQVAKGDRVTLTVIAGQAGHDLSIEAYNVKTKVFSTTGEQDVLRFTADREGRFPYFCTIPGHREAGMEGELVVGTPSTVGPGPARPVDVPDIARDPTDVPPPIARSTVATVHIYLESREVVAEIQPGTTFSYWTFNGTVPGPFFRVRVNDTVVVHLRNAASSANHHSVDFHAVTGPGGGAVATDTAPGAETGFAFKALNPGLYVYHCATPHIPSHIAMGLYGLILVEPEGGLPTVDREFYVMQGDIYTKWSPGTAGHQEFDGTRMRAEDASYVVFNGRFQALTGANALQANVNETVRVYFGVGGPNLVSSFHVIGEIFDRVYLLGDLVTPPLESIQTVLVPPGGAAGVTMRLEVPGAFILVDHSLVRAIDKGAVGILVVSGPSNPEVFQPLVAVDVTHTHFPAPVARPGERET